MNMMLNTTLHCLSVLHTPNYYCLLIHSLSLPCYVMFSWSCGLCLHQLYPSLCELAHVLSVDGPVKQRLDTLAGELAKAADKELQVKLEVEVCPLIPDASVF